MNTKLRTVCGSGGTLKHFALIAVFLLCLALYCRPVSAFEESGSGRSILGDNRDVIIFINAKILPGYYFDDDLGKVDVYDYVIENDRLYVSPEFIQNELNTAVDPAGGKYPVLPHGNSIYVALRPVAEDLGMTVNYTPEMTGPYEYYYDTRMPISPENTIVRGNPNVIIDKPYDGPLITQEEAIERTKALCLEALENFRKKLQYSMLELGEDPNRFDMECGGIEKEINRMLYIGEISRFYKFTIGPYDVLYDKYSGKAFFVIYSSNTIIKEVNKDDEGLYMPVFMVG